MAYLEGELRGDVVGIGGEHTGYVLEVEVDMSAVQNAQELAGEHVAVTGEVVIVDYPERGNRPHTGLTRRPPFSTPFFLLVHPVSDRTYPLFTGVRGIRILRTSHVRRSKQFA